MKDNNKMSVEVTFTDDIPKIEREGFKRKSKYADILDACVEREGKAARITVDTQGQASSRASSLKGAAEKHSKVVNGEGYFEVATRSGDEEDEFHVFIKFVSGEAPEKKERKPRTKKVAKAKKAA